MSAGSNAKKLRVIDVIVTFVFLCTAAWGIYLFREDLLRTLDARDAEPAGYVIIRENIVQRRYDDRVVWDRLFNESPVYSGDLIRAAELSSAMLYIGDNEIYLGENTLIRIQHNPEGQGQLRVELREGSVSISGSQEEDSQEVFLEYMGLEIQAGQGTVLDAEAGDEGIALQVSEGSVSIVSGSERRDVTQGQIIAMDSAGTEIAPPAEGLRNIPRNINLIDTSRIRLNSPSIGIIFKYQTDYPQIRFQWERRRNVTGYIIEISSVHNFSEIKINRQVPNNSFVTAELGQGTWYWRVKPVYPDVFAAEPDYSYTGFFSVEQTAGSIAIEIPDVIIMPDPSIELPPPQPRREPEPAAVPRGDTYTVQRGDTLTRIAANVLGDASQWIQIVRINNITNPDLIYPGQVFLLP